MMSSKITKKYDLVFIIPNYNSSCRLQNIYNKIKNSRCNLSYAILIQDNNSSDSSINFLLKHDDDDVFLIRNSKNIGRIQNWNLAYSNAQNIARYGIFVFTGDTLTNLTNLYAYFGKIKNTNFLMSIFPYWIINNKRKKLARNLDEREVNSLQLAQELISSGNLSFGILQSNIFNLSFDLTFDPKYPFITDQLTIARYLLDNSGSVYVSKIPFVQWLVSSNRYHFDLSLTDQMQQTLTLLNILNSKINYPIDMNHAHTLNFLRILNFYRNNHKFKIFEFIKLIKYGYKEFKYLSFKSVFKILFNVKR